MLLCFVLHLFFRLLYFLASEDCVEDYVVELVKYKVPKQICMVRYISKETYGECEENVNFEQSHVLHS